MPSKILVTASGQQAHYNVRVVEMFVIPVRPPCLLGMLTAVALGFTLGKWARFSGGDSTGLNAVMTARYYASRSLLHQTPEVPTLPRSIFLSSLFLTLMFLRGVCPHLQLFLWLSVICTLSSGSWLFSASDFQRTVDEERRKRIEAFVADPHNVVPEPVPGLEAPPPRLKRWYELNVGLFLLVIVGFMLSVRLT